MGSSGYRRKPRGGPTRRPQGRRPPRRAAGRRKPFQKHRPVRKSQVGCVNRAPARKSEPTKPQPKPAVKASVGSITCWQCGRKGHVKAECRSNSKPGGGSYSNKRKNVSNINQTIASDESRISYVSGDEYSSFCESDYDEDSFPDSYRAKN